MDSSAVAQLGYEEEAVGLYTKESILPTEEQVKAQEELKHAQNVLRVMLKRKKCFPLGMPVLSSIKYHQDGNLTVAMIETKDNEFIGWAKFNPSDIRHLMQTSKRGRYHIKTETKFNEKAGQAKALHRALEKVVKV